MTAGLPGPMVAAAADRAAPTQIATTSGRAATAPGRVRLVCERVVQTARLMVGVPDYQTYVTHRQTVHPDQPFMNYQEFFRERQNARYAIGKGRFRGCC